MKKFSKFILVFATTICIALIMLVTFECGMNVLAIDSNISTSSISSTPMFKGKITASALNIRSGASTSHRILGVFYRGSVVDIYGETDGWYAVKYKGQMTYICGRYVTISSTTSTTTSTTTLSSTGTVTASALNVRSGAGTNYSKVGLLYRGATVSITSKTGRWYSILHNGTIRYVCADYINTSVTQSTTSSATSAATTNTTSSDKMTSIGRFKITGYDACKKCCGKTDGITASGVKATAGRTIAMKGYPFGTKIYIEGLGTYIVEDRGVGSGVIDVFCNNHTECYAITGYRNAYMVN